MLSRALLFTCASIGTVAVAGAQPPPRLSGILVGPDLRLAFFADKGSARTLAVLAEGARFEDYRVQSIEPDQVTVIGPAGVLLLRPEPVGGGEAAPAGLPPAPAETGAFDAGAELGRLALQRDNCVREGHLPGVRIDAETQVHGLIVKMARVPHRDGAEGATDAPVAAMSAAMEAGLEAARREGADRTLNAGACGRIKETWFDVGGRYGLR